jgi:glycosyltransferase involved in cell wall biosynthesis
MLRHARNRGVPVNWTFYCTLDAPGALEQAARDLGAEVIHSPVPLVRTTEFLRALRLELLRGRYHVMHAHHDLLNGLYFLASIGTLVRKRISHVHNADESIPTASPLKRKLSREPLRFLSIRLSHSVVGISNHTLDTFLNGRARRKGRDVVLYYGVDASPYAMLSGDSSPFRRLNSIAAASPLILFAGRMVPEKNPTFVVDVLAEVRKAVPDAVAVFAGTGTDEAKVTARATELGVRDSIRLIGWRDDLPAVLTAADCFILPHPDRPPEGFGLAVVEAQLAGCRMLLSNGIADDPLLPTAVFRRLSLDAGPHRWSDAFTELLRMERPSRQSAIAALERSPMQMDAALGNLLSLHRTVT